MMMQILYCKNFPDGYNKISAIKSIIEGFGIEELDSNNFGVVILEITNEQSVAWNNNNKYCIDETGTKLIETPEEYQI